MRNLRAVFVTATTAAMLVAPGFVHGMVSTAGARVECTIEGTAADDVMTGTTRDDVICTRAGDDSATGLEGNDTIKGGSGDEYGVCSGCGPGLEGNGGNDIIKGQSGEEDLYGGGGNDNLYTGRGNYDNGYGEAGDDFIKTVDQVGNDTADGGDNTDTCRIDPTDTAVNCEL
jgi:Ca2+-binding RTX toxin-like protein